MRFTSPDEAMLAWIHSELNHHKTLSETASTEKLRDWHKCSQEVLGRILRMADSVQKLEAKIARMKEVKSTCNGQFACGGGTVSCGQIERNKIK